MIGQLFNSCSRLDWVKLESFEKEYLAMKRHSWSQRLQAALATLLSLGVIAVSMPVSAKPKPRLKPQTIPITETVSDSVTSSVPDSTYWNSVLNDITDDDQDEQTLRIVDNLRSNFNLQSELLGLFGQDSTIAEILREILEDQSDQDYYPDGTIVRYEYIIDRSCLPPGQVHRLDSGKPVPPGILKKCGNIVSLDD